ncbi:MAG: SpaA isopeptide-forming pilin-related protein, partial [Pygmaiobacter sp.]
SSFTVRLADDGNAVIISTVDGVAASGLTVNVTNTQILGSVGIAKTGANGAALADVTFEVYRSAEKPVYTAATKTWSGDLVGEMTTDRQGNATLGGLTIGNYWAIETAAPGAYELIAEPIALGAITKDGALESVPVSNTQIDGSITVNKVDENGKALAGATFALYRVEGRSTNFFTNLVNTVKNVFDSKAVSGARFVSEKTTGADGVAKFEHLAPGRYYVVETAAPEGYALNSTPSAVMNVMRGGGKQNNHTLTVENSKITQLLTFNKVDAAGNLRNGAEFVILSAKNADGSKATTPTLTTVDGNTWSFTAVHGVTYTLHESKTPAGYETIQDFTLKLETVNGKTAVAASAGIAAVGTT